MGNTLLQWQSEQHSSVHPHACGEHFSDVEVVTGQNGSSPPMWGTPFLTMITVCGCRFIPTRVGNLLMVIYILISWTVHPHACGEHALPHSMGVTFDGSSPRMWGTLLMIVFGIFIARFIPTHVGNTRGIVSELAPVTVHPHACGEHGNAALACSNHHGSSPRGWGTPLPTLQQQTDQRFIPTRVGNTFNLWRYWIDISVHPHTGGEH